MWEAYRDPARFPNGRTPSGRGPRRRPSGDRLRELHNAGAVAEVTSGDVVTFRIAGRIADQFTHRDGSAGAAAYATQFNKAVGMGQVNPSNTGPDIWR
jgi:hypothetical protein